MKLIDERKRLREVIEMDFLPAEIIKSKRMGKTLSADEIDFFIQGYVSNQIPDYQMSALLMAIFFQGMTTEETLSLTQSMIHSGESVSFPKDIFCVDKHSTGGVGDKTSLILAPIVAAAGIRVPMISGRGLGHTGGTLDKLESIPGFSFRQSLPQFKKIVQDHSLCFIGQTENICPADKKIYALRDVTATVESYPLICASIMSKKIAEGIHGLVLDVKCGSGAFMKTPEMAEELAQRLMGIAKGHGLKVTSLITNMDRPMGRFAGNSLEVFECLEIMRGKSFAAPAGYDLYADTRELSLELAAHMIWQAGKARNYQEAYQMAGEILNSGKALKKFQEIIEIQGGNLEKLPMPGNSIEIRSLHSGFVSTMNTEKIGLAGVKIGAGRAMVTDIIEPTAGIEFFKKPGDKVASGEVLFKVHGTDVSTLQKIEKDLLNAVQIESQCPRETPLVFKTLQG